MELFIIALMTIAMILMLVIIIKNKDDIATLKYKVENLEKNLDK